jgi:hypothetical protein
MQRPMYRLSLYSVVIFRLLYAQNVPMIRKPMFTTKITIANARDDSLAVQLAYDAKDRSKLSVASFATRVHSSGATKFHESNKMTFTHTCTKTDFIMAREVTCIVSISGSIYAYQSSNKSERST